MYTPTPHRKSSIHQKSLTRADHKTDLKIRSNNNEISLKILEAKEKANYSAERTPSSYKTSNNFFKIPRLDLKNIQKTPKKLESINSQRSFSKSIVDEGFFSQRANNLDEYMLKTSKVIKKEKPENLNEGEEGLQRDLSHILDKKNKITKKMDGVTMLIHLGQNKKNTSNHPFTDPPPPTKENRSNSPDRKNELFTEIFEILEKEDQENDSIPTFFQLKDYSNIKSIEQPSIGRFSFLQDLMNPNTPHNYSQVFLNKLLEDLKRNHPNLFTNSPSGRRDVLILKEWLFATLKTIFSTNEIHKKEKFVIADETFNLCIGEIIRQISFDCLERGELISAIWRNYLNFFTKVLRLQVQQKLKFQEDQENEYLKYTKIYREQLEEKEAILREKVQIAEKLKVEIVVLKSEVEQWKKIEQNNNEKTEKIRKWSDQLLIKCKKLQAENEALRFNLNKYREQSKSRMTRSIMTTSTTRNLFSSPTFEESEEKKSDNSDKDSETEAKNMKDIMKLLGEDEGFGDDKDDRGNFDNPIIVKCFQEQKEKILFVKSTEIDREIRDSFFHSKGLQTDLVLADNKYDNILNIDVLEETMKERDIRKNMLKFKVDKKRESIKKFVEVVQDVQRRSSIVTELLNCISPTKQSQQSKSRMNSSKNSRKNSTNSIDSSNDFREGKLNQNELKLKFPETVEIKMDVPVVGKTIIEKRNSIIYELSKKIMEKPKPSLFKIDLSDEKDTFSFKNEEIKEKKPGHVKNISIFAINSSKDLLLKETVKDNKDNKDNNEKNEDDLSKSLILTGNNNNNNNEDENLNKSIENFEPPKSSEKTPDETPKPEKEFGNTSEKLDTKTLNKSVHIKTSSPRNSKNHTPIISPKTSPRGGTKIINLNVTNSSKPNPNARNRSRRPSNFSNDKKLPIPQSNTVLISQKFNRAKSKRHITEKETDWSPQNKMKMSAFPSFKTESKQDTSPRNNQDNLREKIKQQNAADFLANYLGSSLDRMLENSSEKQPISVVLPKSILKNLNSSSNQENDEIIDNNNNMANNPIENETMDEELKNKILDIIQIFQVETEKNDDLAKVNSELRNIILTLIEFIKKVLAFIKDKTAYLEKYEEFYKSFLEIRSKIPRNVDPNYEQEIKENIRKKILKKTKNVTKFFLVPKLGNLISKTNVIDKENHPGMVITKKIKDLGKFKNTSKLLHQKQALKVISQIYDEKLAAGRDNPQNKELEMQIFAFNIFLNRYGIKKVAERKFTEFVLTVKNYLHIFRINVFARLLNILDNKLSYSVDEMKKYLEGFEYLTEISTSGNTILHEPSDLKRYVPYIRGLDFIRVFSENKLSHEEITDLRKELDSIKENDPKNINKNGIIDMDVYLTKILTKYRHIMNRTKTYVVNAFNACDLDGNKMCNLSEFVLLYRHIEKDKFKEEDVVKLFEEQADLITDSQKNMSFDKFTAICVDYQLFSDAQQIKYLKIEESAEENRNNLKELQKKFDDMQMNWNSRKIKIDGKLTMLKQNLDKDDYDNWRSILDQLEKRVLTREEGMEVKPILIAYKIMEDELERLLQKKEELEEYEEVDVEEEALV